MCLSVCLRSEYCKFCCDLVNKDLVLLIQVKVTQELKTTHTEQLTRLHFKHQTECDLLEDMR